MNEDAAAAGAGGYASTDEGITALLARDHVLARARSQRAPGTSRFDVTPVNAPINALLELTDALYRDLATLTPAQWMAPASHRYSTVKGLVAHLLCIDRYLLALLGDPVEIARFGSALTDGSALDHVGFTLPFMAEAADHPGDELRVEWIDAARRSARACANAPEEERFVVHDLWLSGTQLNLLRAFEVWAHHLDIAAAVGRPAPDLAPPIAARMGSTLAGALNFAMLLTPDPSGATDTVDPLARSFRVVLTGPGGGTYDLGPVSDASGPPVPEAVVALDLVDFCRVAAGRAAVDSVRTDVEGDEALANHALHAAAIFVRD